MEIVRLKPYLRGMKSMGLGEIDMRRIETAILQAPEKHPVIVGMKGVRKARFAGPGTGKSGGGRAIYFLSYGQGFMAMLAAYSKSAKDDLTSEDRRALLRLVETLTRGEGT